MISWIAPQLLTASLQHPKRKLTLLTAAFNPSRATCLGWDAGRQHALGSATHRLNPSLVGRACWKDLPQTIVHWGYSLIPDCTILFLMWVYCTREEHGQFPLLWWTFYAVDSVHYSTTVKLSDILPLVQPQQSTASLLSSTYLTGFAVSLSG